MFHEEHWDGDWNLPYSVRPSTVIWQLRWGLHRSHPWVWEKLAKPCLQQLGKGTHSCPGCESYTWIRFWTWDSVRNHQWGSLTGCSEHCIKKLCGAGIYSSAVHGPDEVQLSVAVHLLNSINHKLNFGLQFTGLICSTLLGFEGQVRCHLKAASLDLQLNF